MTPLVVTDETPEEWRLLEPLTYQGSRDTFTVPAGYVTNFASVPRLLWWFIPRYGRYTKATVLHDCLCDGRRRRCGAPAGCGWHLPAHHA